MSKKNIKNALQSWHNPARRHGHAETETGRPTDPEAPTPANKPNAKPEHTTRP